MGAKWKQCPGYPRPHQRPRSIMVHRELCQMCAHLKSVAVLGIPKQAGRDVVIEGFAAAKSIFEQMSKQCEMG